MKLPEVIITERDATMFEMRKQGLTYRQIGKAMNVSESTAYKGCKRVSDKIIKQLSIDYGQEFIVDLQRLEGMYANFAPLARPQKIVTDDGEEITIPPSVDAANVLLKILDKKARLLGLDQGNAIEINIGSNNVNAPALPSAETEDGKETTPEDEARKLLKVMREAGIIDESFFAALKETANLDDIVDAEIVEDDDQLELEAQVIEPPSFVDDYDEESPEMSWNPEV
jgi:hypothetical protein